MKNDMLIELILSYSIPRIFIKPFKLLLKCPFVKTRIVIDYEGEEETSHEDYLSPLEKDMGHHPFVFNGKNTGNFTEGFIRLLQQYKKKNFAPSQVVDIFNDQLTKYKIEMTMLPRLVYSYWEMTE